MFVTRTAVHTRTSSSARSSSLASFALILVAVDVITFGCLAEDENSLRQRMWQARAPPDIAQAATDAALRTSNVGEDMEGPLREAVSV